MKEYGTTMRSTVLAAVVVALIVAGGLVATSIWFPGRNTTTTTTTTTTTHHGNGFGAMAMEYLQSKRNDVLFYWMCNSTFVNNNLTFHYQQSNDSAYVDGVCMKHEGPTNEIRVLFAPSDMNITGIGSINQATWESFSGLLVNDSVGQMDDALSHPQSWPNSWPIDFFIEIYFNDNTLFYLGYTKNDGLAYIQNGTWTGNYMPNGWPWVTGYASTGYWLLEEGHLQSPLAQLYEIITQAVSYPSP